MLRPRLLGTVFLLTLGLCGCQTMAPLPAWQSPEGREHAQLGQIIALKSGKPVSAAALVEQLATAPRVLVGEQHDNPDHHALQLWLLRALQTRRAQGSLLLEMLEPAQQARVDALKHPLPLPDDLPAALAWQSGWDWSVYGPIVREALGQPYPLLAANLDRNEVGQIYRQRPSLAGEHSNAAPVAQALLAHVREGHCALLPESQMPAMLAVQQQRDRRIAQRVLAAPTPALLLAGSFHVRKDLGVPLHLQDLGVGEGTQVLMLAQVGEHVDAQMADFVWYTAALPAQDYCASLRKE